MFDITDNQMPPEIDSGIELLVQILSDALKGKSIFLYYSTLLCAFAPFLVGTGNLVRGFSLFFLQKLFSF